MDQAALVQATVSEFLEVVYAIHGGYLDAVAGCMLLVDEYDQAREEMIKQRPGLPLAAFDGAGFTYMTDDPRKCGDVAHECTQGEYRARNEMGGRNHKMLGQSCLVHIFSLWEDEFRNTLARVQGVDKKLVAVDVMGDVRLIRNSIIHHHGVGKDALCKCKTLTWFKEGDDIVLTPDHFKILLPIMRKELGEYAGKAGTKP